MKQVRRAFTLCLSGMAAAALLWAAGFGGGAAAPDTALALPRGLALPDPTATPAPEQSPPPEEPAGTAEPTSAPVFSVHDGDRADVTVVKYFEAAMPADLPVALKYDKYAAFIEYFVVLKSTQVRELPNGNGKSLKKVGLATRLPLLAEVKGTDGESTWYRVRLDDGSVGYIVSTSGSVRVFQVDKAIARVRALKRMADKPSTVRINNYKNANGSAPKLPGGETTDAYGYVRDQAAPAYLVPDKASGFRYALDGTLGQLLSMKGDFAEVYFPTFDEVRYVPKKYVTTKGEDGTAGDVITELTQAVVVDRANQNVIVFEYQGGRWSVVSMSFVSTGKKGKYERPTPVGDYFTKTRPLGKYKLGEFWFLADGTDENAPDLRFSGYAPYGIRFCSGAYLHGLPKSVSYSEDGVLQMPKSRTTESSTCLGTTPQSHMCVRNYTSHAKFMYEWIRDGSACVIVIE